MGGPSGEKPSALRVLMALSRRRLLAAVGLSALMAALGLLSLYSRLAIFSDGTVRPSAGDVIVWLFMGNPLGLAPEWGALWCLVLVLSIGDVRGLVDGVGTRQVVACGDRGTFWRGLCLATAICALVACLLAVFFVALFAVLAGGALTLAPVCIATASLGAISAAVGPGDVMSLLALLALGAVSFSLLELALSLRLGRPATLAVCVALLLGSAYLPLLPLPGSWLMASRLEAFASATTVTAAWPLVPGACLLACVGILAAVLGGRAFAGLEFGLRRAEGSVPLGRFLRKVTSRRPSPLRYCAAAGARPLVPVLALTAMVTAAQCVALLTRVSLYAPADSRAGLADFLAFALLGSPQPDPLSEAVSVARLVSIPFGWLVLVLLPQAWTHLFCRAMDRREVPTVLSGSRLGMWLTRCVVTALACLLVFLAELATCLLAAAVTGGALAGGCSPWLADVAGLPRETLPAACEGLSVFLAGFALVSLGLSLAQLAIAELVGGVAGLIAAVIALAGSVFLMTPLLPGNYLMCARSTVFVVPWRVEVQAGLLQAGLDPAAGIVVALLLGLAACLAGANRARSRELLGGAGR